MREGPPATAVHVSLRWGEVVLRTACVEAPGRFVLGDGGDWELPAEALGGARMELLRMSGDALLLSAPRAPVRALRLGSRAHVELGALSVDVEVALAEPHVRRRVPLAHPLSLALTAGIVAMLALLVPRLRPDEPDAEDTADRVAFLLHALDGSAPRERGHSVVVAADDDESAPGSRGHGEEGSPVSSVSTRRAGRAERPRDEPDGDLSRESALRLAATFGLATGLLSVPLAADPRAPFSPWGRTSSSDRESARAPLWGDTLGDAFGSGGLGLSGTGEGGGGRADGMGLEDIGALGRGAGGERGEGIASRGIGSSGSFGRGAHQVRVIRDGWGCRCSVSGRLGPDAIQRIVRANFGRFRACYENGLAKNPALEGRVTARFLIARDGSVGYAADGGSDLPDASTVACVVGAFSGLSFPEPAGGTVVVDYPIAFSPE